MALPINAHAHFAKSWVKMVHGVIFSILDFRGNAIFWKIYRDKVTFLITAYADLAKIWVRYVSCACPTLLYP